MFNGKIMLKEIYMRCLIYQHLRSVTMNLAITTTSSYFTYIKDATSVSFRSKLFTSYILIIFKQRNLLP